MSRRSFKAAIAGILALFTATVAAAQTFPTVPANSVIGRLGNGPGPAQAIPNSQLFSANLFDLISTTPGRIPCRGASTWGPISPGAAGGVLMSTGTTTCPAFSVPVPVASGGTGGITAAAARSSTGINVESYTSHNDSNYTILASDRTVGTSAALTAARTWTLPAANSVNAGQAITVADYFGGVTSTNTLTIQRAGSDTINGATSVVINVAYGRYEFRSDGVSKWSAVATSSNSLPIRTPMDYGAVCDGSTDDRTAIQAWLNAISGAYIGMLPPGKVCTYSQFVIVPSNVTIFAYGATFKARNGANAATGFLLTDLTGGTAAGPSNVAIYGGTWDGNKANRTGPFSYANIYAAGASNVTVQDVISINCTADCFYFGGNSTTTGVSTNVHASNLTGRAAQRNGISLVGVQNFRLDGCLMTGSVTAPGHGIDVEPDDLNTANSDFVISNCNLSGNGGAGIAINPAAIAGAAVNRSMAFGLSANSNGACGFDQYVTTANAAGFRFIGASGAFNTGGTFCNLAADKVP
ncbi:glycoside hydrolase family protein [Bradyrhizobium ottawaense]|uniref:hypothetical protein n=1 Tax=Bradyrhizobium ottawaense TaxID=931866 RepID=UPI00041BEEF5|nr:hypothetical protein [Bradyrhizobium ottawaense]